jgi:ParB family chromosome partitioning protein
VNKRKALGADLDALLKPSMSHQPQPAPAPVARDSFHAPIEEVFPNRAQPRTRFDDAKLEELAQSIREHGVLEPILVRKRPAGGYEIVAGERRWRAAQRAGLKDVPVFVRELSAERAFEAALVENLQREDLNPIETARAFQRLCDEHGHTQDSIAERVGKDRSTVANALRLLKLPAEVLDLVEQGRLSEGHGRALLGAKDVTAMQKLAREALAKEWSVRETERHARGTMRTTGATKAAGPSANVRDLETKLTHAMGTKVTLADRRGKGQIQIRFASYDELDRLLEKLMG